MATQQKVTTLSLKGSVGTVARNRDNSHEESVIHLTGEDGVTGQLSVRLPVQRDDKGEEVPEDQQGLTAGEYTVSVSLTKAALEPDRPADGNSALLSEEQVRSPRTRRDVSGG